MQLFSNAWPARADAVWATAARSAVLDAELFSYSF